MVKALFASVMAIGCALFAGQAANAADDYYCDLAEQLTQPKVSPECRAVFIDAVSNEQDKIELRRFFDKYQAPDDLEISTLEDGIVQIRAGDHPTLNIAYVSQEPLMVIINNHFYMDESKDDSYARRFEKIFAKYKADSTSGKTASIFPFSPLLFGEEARAVFGPPPDIETQIGHTFSIVTNGSDKPLTGSAADVLKKLGEDEGFAPNYAGSFASKGLYNVWQMTKSVPALLTNKVKPEPMQDQYFSKFTCDKDGGIKEGKYRLGEKGVVARMVGKDTVAIKGLLKDGREVKVKLGTYDPRGQLCVDRFTSDGKGKCAKTWKAFVNDHKDQKARKQFVSMTKGHRKPSCRNFRTSELRHACSDYFASSLPNKGQMTEQDAMIVYDGKKAHSELSICKPDSKDCSSADAVKSFELAKLFDPTGRNGRAEADAYRPALQYDAMGAATGMDEQAADETKADKRSTRGRRGRNGRRAAAVEARSGKQEAKKAEESPDAQIGHDLHLSLDKIAVGMSMYSTLCKDPKGREKLDGIFSGTEFHDSNGKQLPSGSVK